MPLRDYAITGLCHYGIMPLRDYAIRGLFHYGIMPLRDYAKMPLRYYAQFIYMVVDMIGIKIEI